MKTHLIYGRYIVHENGDIFDTYKSMRKLKAWDNNGQLSVNLKIGETYVRKGVSRIVAEAFLDNPNKFRYVKPIDGNNHNTHVNNLAWCNNTISLNPRGYNIQNRKYVVTLTIGAGQVKFIGRFDTAEEATQAFKKARTEYDRARSDI